MTVRYRLVRSVHETTHHHPHRNRHRGGRSDRPGRSGRAGTGDDAERPITGAALTQASDAALEHLGEGTVTETEEGDEDSYYEVEVTLDSGRQVDVQLDENFEVVGSSPDDESETDDG